MHQGSCLCGKVRYEIDGEIGPLVFCHCARCRKVNGSAFLAAAPVATHDFRLIEGYEVIKEWESAAGIYRVFCGECASPLYSRRDAMPETIRLRVGSLDTPFNTHPTAHIFVSEKAEWFTIGDAAPQFAERP